MNKLSLEIPSFTKISTINFLEDLPKIDFQDRPSAVITDKNLHDLYGNWLKRSFPNALLHIISPGELSKSRQEKSKIEDFLLSHNFPRSGQIIAFGGGVVGDLAGYVAATYKRGVDFIQIPTSLLAMVDSSVGGKTAINTPAGKNLIGAFWQPKTVEISPNFLQTLDQEQFLGGLAEVIKIAITFDADLLNFIKLNKDEILNKEKKTILYLIQQSVSKKAEVVQKDETEKGLRALLNFGHTVAHGIEIISAHKIIHGNAVALGIAIESILSYQANKLPETDLHEILTILKEFGYLIPINYDTDELIAIMHNDKKNKANDILFVDIATIGKANEELISFTPEQISEAISYYQKHVAN